METTALKPKLKMALNRTWNFPFVPAASRIELKASFASPPADGISLLQSPMELPPLFDPFSVSVALPRGEGLVCPQITGNRHYLFKNSENSPPPPPPLFSSSFAADFFGSASKVRAHALLASRALPSEGLNHFPLPECKSASAFRARCAVLEKNGNEEETFSKCSAYNLTVAEILEGSERNVTTERHIIDCEYGWEYDTTWYSSTAPSDSDWVCDRSLNVNNAFACARVGDFLGTLLFGQLGDIIGRKPVFLMSLALVITGRLITAAAVGIYPLFALSMLLSNSGANAVFQTLLAIGIEMSGKGAHSCINTVQYIAWTIGLSLLPFIQWGSKGWRLFMIFTTVPTALFLFAYRLVPESARWLTSKGRTKEASFILNNIAKANKRKLPANYKTVLNQLSDSCKDEKCYGIISLFSSLNMAKYTIMLMICWIITPVSYDVLLLNIRNLSGNPYLNFFYQSIVELPAYAVGMWMTDSIGRRWTQVFALLLNSFTCGGIILLKSYYDLQWFSIILVMFSKFFVSLSFYTLYLQSLEIYPTCIRQTGSAAGVITGSAFGVLAPYIVYLGSNLDTRYPYLCMGALALLGTIASSFLPETMDEHLPETLNDACVFGKDQKYWHIPWRRKKGTTGIEMDVLSRNVHKYTET